MRDRYKDALADAERLVKRCKKNEIAGHMARATVHREEEMERVLSELHAAVAERDGLKRELRALTPIHEVVRTVLGRRMEQVLSAKQLDLALRSDRERREEGGDIDAAKLTTVEELLATLVDNCDKFIEEMGGGYGAPSYYEIDEALAVAQADREELLKLLRMTDREWSARGGTSYTDVEP